MLDNIDCIHAKKSLDRIITYGVRGNMDDVKIVINYIEKLQNLNKL